MRVGELREWLLADSTDEAMIKRLSNGLTSEMVAAVTKLMSNLDLMLAASKISIVKHCNNTIGLPGTLAPGASRTTKPTRSRESALPSMRG